MSEITSRAGKLVESLESCHAAPVDFNENYGPSFTLVTLQNVQKKIQALTSAELLKLGQGYSYSNGAVDTSITNLKIIKKPLMFRQEYRSINCFVEVEYTDTEDKQALIGCFVVRYDIAKRRLTQAEFTAQVREK